MTTAVKMKTRVNLKAVLILGGCGLAFGVGIHFLHAFQLRRNAHALFEDAVLEEENGKPGQAADLLRQYLGLNPRAPDAQAKYGLLLDKLAEKDPRKVRKAFDALSKALREDGSRVDVRRRVAQLALRMGRFAEARSHFKLVLDAHPDDVELMRDLGRCEAGLGQAEEARNWFLKAIEVAPNNIEICVEFARLLRGYLKLGTEADEMMDMLVTRLDGAKEQAVAARLARARYLREFARLDPGKWEKAEADVAYALGDLKSKKAELLLLAAELAMAQRKNQPARLHLERGLKLYPDDTRFHQGMAQLELAEGHTQRAVAALKPSLARMPSDTQDLWNLANLLIDAGAEAKAKIVIKRLSDEGTTSAVRFLEARLLIGKGVWGEARVALEKIASTLAASSPLSTRVHMLLAQCYGRLENPDERLAAYRRVLDAAPYDVAALRGLATSLAALGKIDQAIAEYQKLVGHVRHFPELRIELARLLLRRTLRLPEAERRWTAVDQALDKLPDARQKTLDVRLLRAQILMAQKKNEEARALVIAERDRDPKQVGPWTLLVRLADLQGEMDLIPDLLDSAAKQAGRHVEWPLLRIGYITKTAKDKAKPSLRALEAGLKEYQADERDQLILGLAEGFAALGDRAAAGRLWRTFVQNQPTNLSVRFMLFEIAIQENQDAQARQLLDEIRRIEGAHGALSAYGEAALGVAAARRGDKKGLPEARRQLALAASLRPTWSRVPLMRARIHDLEGQVDKAVEQYQAAVDRGEGRLPVVRRLLELYYQQGRFTDASALLAKLPKDRVIASPELGRLAAQLSLANPEDGEDADPERARKDAWAFAEKAVSPTSKDYRDFLWLGQMAVAAERPKDAEKAFRDACRLGKDAPAAWVTLIIFLAQTDAKKAEAEMAEAKRVLPPAQAPNVLAAGYEALGKLKLAEKHYQAARAAKSNDPLALANLARFYARTGESAKSEPFLRQLLEATTKAPPATVAWARRALALTLGTQGSYASFEGALKLLDKNGKNAAATLEDRRARALILARHPAHRRDAIRLLEGLSSRQVSAPAGAQFMLAQLYEADGKWSQAKGQMLALLKAHPRNPNYLASYVGSLLRHEQAAEARAWIDKLAAVAPDAFATLALRARVLKANAEADEALTLVKAYAEKKDARLDLAAALLDQVGQTAEAEKMYRSFVAASKRPETVLVLAAFLSRHQRLPDSLAILADAWKTCAPEPVAATCVGALRAAGGDERQQRQVEGWLRAAIDKKPRSLGLLVLLADLQMFRGEHDAAIRIYRQILAKDPSHVVALNNLAFHLALHEGKPSEAEKLIDKAIGLAGPAAVLLDTQATVYLEGKKPREAKSALERALIERPSAPSYFHLAQAELMAKNRPAARDAFDKASRLGLKAADLHLLEQGAFRRFPDELEER